MRKIVIFDDTLKTRTGRRIPFYHEQTWGSDDDTDCKDQSLHWFHEGYGQFQLYRLHEVKDDSSQLYLYYIAESLRKFMHTGNENWDLFSDHPELALES